LKKFLSIFLSIALLLCMVAVPVSTASAEDIADLTASCSAGVVTVSGTIGTTADKPVTIKVYPTGSADTILHVDQINTGASGRFSFMFKLSSATSGQSYTASVRGDGFTAPDTVAFTYSAAAVTPPPTPGGGGGGGGGTTPTTPTAPGTVTVGGGSVDKQTSTVDGKTVETFTVKTDVTKQITDAKDKGKDTVDIQVPASNTATTVIQVPNEVLNSAQGMSVNISSRNVSLELPKTLVDALAKSGQDLNITIERGTASEATAQLGGVKGAEGAKVLGNPTHINTPIKGNTTVTLPLEGITIPTEPAAQKAFLDSLAILAVHSDKSKELIQGTIVYENNIPVGISFEVDRFSLFAIIKKADEPTKPVVTLTDISGHWAQANIEKLVAAGAISGYPDKTFKPDANISRAEFAVTLVKALKLAPKSGKVFNDTAKHWAKDSIATAQAYGIINGYSDTQFGPDDKITREQMAVMVAKAANLTAGANAKTFTDAAKVSAWAKDAVIATSSNGIINGYPDGSFKPQANATRAEAVTVIAKVLK